MSVYKLFLDELAEFKKAYFGNLSERIATIKINYLKALNVLGLESTADGGFIEIEDALRKVDVISSILAKSSIIITSFSAKPFTIRPCKVSPSSEDTAALLPICSKILIFISFMSTPPQKMFPSSISDER